MKRTEIALVGLVVLIGLGGCVNRQAQQQAKRTEQIVSDPSRPVTVARVGTANLAATLEISGAITTSLDTEIGAKAAGRLAAVYVKDGDRVRTGQIIAIQETTDLSQKVSQASAQVSAARSQLSQASTNARLTPQRSAAAVRSAQAQLRQARAQLQKVRAGARMEERAQLRAQVAAAESAKRTADRDLERKRALYAEGAIARQQVEAAENVSATAASQLESARQALAIAENGARPEDIVAAVQQVSIAEEAVRTARANQSLDAVLNEQVDTARANLAATVAQLRIAQQALADAAIKSPFNGRISGRPAQAGVFANPGTPVARVVGVEGVYFEGDVPETEITKIVPGQRAVISSDAWGGRELSGTVQAVNPMGAEVGRLFKVRVQIDAPPSAVKPGMYARGTIVLRSVPGATVVPGSAVTQRNGKDVLFIVEGGKAKSVVVRLGLRRDPLVQVLEGVRPGQEIVVQGQSTLTDNAAVQIQKKAGGAREDAAPGA